MFPPPLVRIAFDDGLSIVGALGVLEELSKSPPLCRFKLFSFSSTWRKRLDGEKCLDLLNSFCQAPLPSESAEEKVIDLFPDRLPGYETPTDYRQEDVEPDLGGTQRLVRAEVFRGRFRNSYEHPEPFVAGEITHVSFELQDLLHTFKRGHRVMVQVQSSWFPFIDRNPQRYVPNIFEAKAEDYVPVTNRVHRSQRYPSHVEIGVLDDAP